MRDSRRQRQQLMEEGDMPVLLLREDEEDEVEPLALLEEDVVVLCCSGSAMGLWAAEVCSWRRREASDGLDINSRGAGRKANRGLLGSAKVVVVYSWTGVMLGVSMLKCEEAGTWMLK